jgi:hypothetical protein
LDCRDFPLSFLASTAGRGKGESKQNTEKEKSSTEKKGLHRLHVIRSGDLSALLQTTSRLPRTLDLQATTTDPAPPIRRCRPASLAGEASV